MDSNLMSCPTCGHSVSNASGACAYCGAIMTEDQAPPSEESETEGNPQSVGEPPPTNSPGPSDATEVAAPVSETPALSDNPAAALETEEPAAQARESEVISLDAELSTEVEEKPESEESKSQLPPVETEPEGKVETATVPMAPETESESDLFLAADADAESVSGAEDITAEDVAPEDAAAESKSPTGQPEPSKSGSNEIQLESAVEEVLLTAAANSEDAAADEPAGSEISEENVIELAEIQNIEEEFKKTSASETATPPQKPVESEDADLAEPSQPKNDSGIPIDPEAGLITESLGDTILLEVADEVQPEAEKGSDKSHDSARTPAGEKALKIEKAAQDMTDAINKRKTAIAGKQQSPDGAASDPEALKKQKAALAKARAAKKQKMMLAKAAALKRKKAAQAKAQALKKQEAAQAGNEKARKNEIAAAKTAASENSRCVKTPDANSKLKKLLERYKGRAVGINYDNSADIREAQVVEANDEYFSVFVKEKNLKFSYPLATILTVIEGKDGVEAGEPGKKAKFNAVVKVYPLVLF